MATSSKSNALPNRRTVLKTTSTVAAAASIGGVFTFGGAARYPNDEHAFNEFTDASQAAIKKGNKWMMKAVNKDGGAGLDIANPSDVGCTSVVGLAFLSQGSTTEEGSLAKIQKGCSEFVLRAVDRLKGTGQLQTARSVIEGDLGPLAAHFFATTYLSCALGEARQMQRYTSAIGRLEQHISSNQYDNGGWGDEAWAPMLGTACGWVALRAANFIGIKVSGSSDKAGDYMISRMPRLGRKWNPSESWYHRLYGTAAGLRVLYAMQREKEPKAKRAMEDIMALVEQSSRAFGGAGGEEYLTFHFLTEMFMQQGGEQWKRWYTCVRDRLIKVQNRDGSWTGHHCITSRTFSTACAMMVLTAPNRYLPISQV